MLRRLAPATAAGFQQLFPEKSADLPTPRPWLRGLAPTAGWERRCTPESGPEDRGVQAMAGENAVSLLLLCWCHKGHTESAQGGDSWENKGRPGDCGRAGTLPQAISRKEVSTAQRHGIGKHCPDPHCFQPRGQRHRPSTGSSPFWDVAAVGDRAPSSGGGPWLGWVQWGMTGPSPGI